MVDIHLINGEVIRSNSLDMLGINDIGVDKIHSINVNNNGEKGVIIPMVSILYFKEVEDE